MAQDERLRERFDKWYEEYPDDTLYLDGMFDAFKAGAEQALSAAPAPSPLTEEQVWKACKLAKVRLDWDDVRELRYFLNCTVASDALVSWTQHASHVKPVAGCHLCKNTLEGEAAVCHICGKEYGNTEELKAHHADLHQLDLNQMLNLAAGKGEAAIAPVEHFAPTARQHAKRMEHIDHAMEAPAGEEPSEALSLESLREKYPDAYKVFDKALGNAIRIMHRHNQQGLCDAQKSHEVELAAAVRQAKLEEARWWAAKVQGDNPLLIDWAQDRIAALAERPAEEPREREGGRT